MASDGATPGRRERSERREISLTRRLNGLDPRRLLYLHEAVAAGSIRAGAERLSTSPSALSRQIVKLETELQVLLLERRGRGVRPTEAGLLLVDYFTAQRASLDGVVARIQDITAMRHGSVALALGEGFLSEVMGEPLRLFAKQHEGLHLDIHVGSTEEIARRVLDDVSHLALVYNPPSEPGLQTHAAQRHVMRVLTHPAHPLARLGRPLTLEDLRGCELGALPGSYGVRQVLLSAEHRGNIHLTPRLTSNSSRALLRFAEEWGGVIVTTAFAAAREVAEGRLAALAFQSDSLESSKVHLVTRRGRRLPVAASRLLHHLRASLGLISQGRPA